MSDEIDRLAQSVVDHSMADAQMEMTQAYLKQGRHLAHMTEAELGDEFVDSFENWAQNFDDEAAYSRVTYVQSEFSLRDLPTPDGRVGHVLAQITDAIRKQFSDGQSPNGRDMVAAYRASLKYTN